jgi:hypothetical protein
LGELTPDLAFESMFLDDSSLDKSKDHKLMEFEWDSNEADANLRKHRVSFEDATRVFLDPQRIHTMTRRPTGKIAGRL